MSNKKTQLLYKQLMETIEENPAPCINQGIFFDTDESIPQNLRNYYAPIAKEICSQCPVMFLCLDYALQAHEPYGIWGGMTPEERQKINPHKA